MRVETNEREREGEGEAAAPAQAMGGGGGDHMLVLMRLMPDAAKRDLVEEGIPGTQPRPRPLNREGGWAKFALGPAPQGLSVLAFCAVEDRSAVGKPIATWRRGAHNSAPRRSEKGRKQPCAAGEKGRRRPCTNGRRPSACVMRQSAGL